jgi:hypothetical protein
VDKKKKTAMCRRKKRRTKKSPYSTFFPTLSLICIFLALDDDDYQLFDGPSAQLSTFIFFSTEMMTEKKTNDRSVDCLHAQLYVTSVMLKKLIRFITLCHDVSQRTKKKNFNGFEGGFFSFIMLFLSLFLIKNIK